MTITSFKNIIKILSIIALVIIVSIVSLVFYLKSSEGQARLSKIVINVLSETLDSEVSGNISYGFPDWVKIENLLIKDNSKDTLVYSRSISADLNIIEVINNKILIEKLEVNGGYVNIYDKNGIYNYSKLLKALESPASDTSTTPPFLISLAKLDLNNFRLKFKDSIHKTDLNVALKNAVSGFNEINLEKNLFDAKDLTLDGLTIKGKLGASDTTATSKTVNPIFLIKNISLNDINWDLEVADLKKITKGSNLNLSLALNSINSKDLNFDIKSLKTSAKLLSFSNIKVIDTKGFNADDIIISDLLLQTNNIISTNGDYSGVINKIRFKERSGLILNEGEAKFSYKKDILKIDNLVMLSESSKISADINIDLSKKPKGTVILKTATLAMKEALLFDPTLVKNEYFAKLQNDKIILNGLISGNADKVNFENLNVLAPQNSNLKITGNIKIFSDPELDIAIQRFNTNISDLDRILPKGTIPANIDLPKQISITGSIKGKLKDNQLVLNINTSDGIATINANLRNFGTNNEPSYSGKFSILDFNAGKTIKDSKLGRVSTDFTFNGKGLDIEKMSLIYDGKVDKVSYDGQIYRNISLNGNLNKQILDSKLSIKDAGADVTWEGTINLKSKNLEVNGTTKVAKLNLKTLGLTTENIELKGDFVLNELILDTEKPTLDFSGEKVVIKRDNKVYPIGLLVVKTENADDAQRIFLKTKFMDLVASGNFKYDQLSDVILGEVNNYFKIPDFIPLTDNPQYLFKLDGNVKYDSVFTAFLPSLEGFSPINIHATLSSTGTKPIFGNIDVPYLAYDSMKVYKTTFDFEGDKKALSYKLISDQFSNPSIRVRNASLIGKVENDIAEFNLAVKDSLLQDIHALRGYVASIDNKIRVSFDESGTMIFYENWSGNPSGYLDYDSNGIFINNIVFTNKNQILRVNSLNDKLNGPLMIFTENLDLNKLTRAFLQDSTVLGGFLDLDLELVDYMEKTPYFTGEYTIENLMSNNVQLGKLTGKAESLDQSRIRINSLLLGKDSKFSLDGVINTATDDNLDLKLHIDNIEAALLIPFTEEIASDLSGNFSGEMKINGSFAQPLIEGFLEFKKFGLKLVETGAKIILNNQRLKIKESKILFDKVEIVDSESNKMSVNGDVNLSNLPDYTYSMTIKSSNFKLVDSQSGDNELYYGEGYFYSDLTLRGKNLDFKLLGDIKVLNKTELTMLLPDDADAKSELESIVEFIDFNKNTTIKKKKVKTESKISFANAVNLNVEITEDAKLNILMDAVTGDIMTVRGKAKIATGFNNNGDLFIVGKYDIVAGVYNLTYQVLKKEFTINENSKSYISWTGDPMSADINITAEYAAGKKSMKSYPMIGAVYDDLKNQNLNIPVRVDLVVTGVISSPNINFELVVNESDVGTFKDNFLALGFSVVNDRNEKTTKASSGKSDVIKNQAIILLVSGAFTPEQFLDNLKDKNSYEDVARKTASDLISSQLNKYASGIIKGIDLDLGVQSGYNAANDSRNTNVSLGVKKKLANDRIIISVGKNFELENKDLRSDEIFDNLEASWNITKSGRYRLKVFRKNQNQVAVEGAVVETGLGFIIAIDYDSWLKLRNK